MPPQMAFFWPCGCFNRTIVPGCVRSAQCTSLDMFASGYESSGVEDLGAKRTVEIGAMVTEDRGGVTGDVEDRPE